MVFNLRKKKDETVVPDEPEGQASGVDPGVARMANPLNTLEQFEKEHKLDPNIPIDELNEVDAALASGNAEKGAAIEEALIEENSPYPEVRAAVRVTDPDVPVNTVRAWVIGMVLCTMGSGVNMLFSLRNPPVAFSTFAIQLISYPVGLGWDLVMPNKEFSLFGLKFNLKPGPFNIKEHVLITVMTNASYGGSGVLYATDVLVAQNFFYGQNFGWGFGLLFGITTLCTGYGLAGVVRRFLVWPAAMIWPSNLVNTALFYTLHDHSASDPSKTNGWSIGRYRFFLYVFVGGFLWYWIPGVLFQALSAFYLFPFIFPDNLNVNKVLGGAHGYGLIPLTFDWSLITGYLSSPLMYPVHAILNTLFGVFFFFVVVSMPMHFGGYWYADYFPAFSTRAYDNTGKKYNVSRILTEDYQFDEEKYMAYSPLYLTTNFALCYGISFAAISSVLVHVLLYHGKELMRQFKEARNQEDDIHMKMMKKYQDAPDWWYIALYILMFAISIGVVAGWDTHFPVWAYILCMIIPIIFVIPIGVIQAITNIQIGLNVLTEFIIGYMLPGRPLAMMMFKNYGYICMSQALTFASDLKLGHYMKVPPRTLFWGQLVASIWSGIVQISVMNWAIGTIKDVCTDDAAMSFSCPGINVFFTASVIWGAIGPARMFSGAALYSPLQWFWLVGFITPIITWLLARRYPKSFWRYVNMPVIFSGNGMIPPATPFNYFAWGTVGLIFNWAIRRKWTGWWMQYNYTLSAALDCGLIISTLIVFFTISLTEAQVPDWWGNSIPSTTLDGSNTAIKNLNPDRIKFGPTTWP